MAIAADIKIELATAVSAISVGGPAAIAAAHIAGQTRMPNSKMAARAKPAGAQIGMAFE